MNSKIRSFTLVEISVALVVSGIVVTVLFKFFFFLSSYRFQRSLSSESLTEVLIAKKVLLNSIEDGSILKELENNSRVKLCEVEDNTVDFYKKTYYLEKDDLKDTLCIYKMKSELDQVLEKTRNGTKY